MCTEDEKNKYNFSLGGSVNFAGHHHFSDALLDGNTPTKDTLDNEFSTYCKICCPCIGTVFNFKLSGPKKELFMALEAWDQHVLNSRDLVTY